MTPRADEPVVEDFEVGQRDRSGSRTVDAELVAACARACGLPEDAVAGARHGEGPEIAPAEMQHALGAQLRLGLWHETGLWPGWAASPATWSWEVLRPLAVTDVVHLDVAVTRCRRRSGEPDGVVHVHQRLLDQDHRVAHQGSSSLRLPAHGRDPTPARHDFGSAGWGEELAVRAGADDAFVQATQTFDGSVQLQAGDDAVQLRIYRGEILAASRSTPAGPTFTIAGSEHAWLELAEAPRNDYIRHAMLGRFRATGNTHEYLRLTKAVVCLWDSIRELAGLHPGAAPSPEAAP